MEPDSQRLIEALAKIHDHEVAILSAERFNPLPDFTSVSSATAALAPKLPNDGIGTQRTTDHLLNDVVKGFNGASLSSSYFGFVTGGSTPAAAVADHLVTLYDQNVQVHLPAETVATTLEGRALEMLLDLLHLDSREWLGRTFTTGATASNILGLACGQQWALEYHLARNGASSRTSAAGVGLVRASLLADIQTWQVLTTAGHSSLSKAAQIVGLGRASVHNIGCPDDPLVFDMEELKRRLSQPQTASIVVLSCGEVNTGGFATHSSEEVKRLRQLCDNYGAWLHVDGAFGMFARCLMDEGSAFARIVGGAAGLELADSITGDAHKMLNVPYDCGFFCCRHPHVQTEVFQNPNAAYLRSNADDLPSPLNIGIENSRRFRALPVYATLIASGRQGYNAMVKRQVLFARAIARWLMAHSAFEVLPDASTLTEEDIFTVVLFRPRDADRYQIFSERIRAGRCLYVSPTVWQGKPAARIAVSNWRTNIESDLEQVTSALGLAIG